MPWHLTQSSAFREILSDPLGDHAHIIWKAWDEQSWQEEWEAEISAGRPMIFCQLPPPPALLENQQARVVWLPMWDHICGKPDEWWKSLPCNLRIVAFSDRVAEKASLAGLPVCRLTFFKNPAAIKPVTWAENGVRNCFYWNRTGLVGPKFLERLSRVLQIDTLYFRAETDPKIAPGRQYTLPDKLGRTRVVPVPSDIPHEQYLNMVSQSHVYVAPRPLEGVGLCFLEAMASGSAVFAYDAPTMNEYIRTGENGYLLRRSSESTTMSWQLLCFRIKRKLAHLGLRRPLGKSPFMISEFQDWQSIRRLNLRQLGETARREHEEGYARWKQDVERYARFLLEWP